MNKRKKGIIATVIFTLVAILYVSPLFIVLMNSFKKKAFINLEPFKLPSEKTFIGAENYVNAVDKYGFLQAVIWTVVITVGSVLVILLCTSMFAWYITRVKSRTTKLLYLLCVFSMVVPFQMVMFTLSLVTDRMQGSYGRVDMGAIMAALVLAVIPIVVFYLSCQKYIIKGVAAGAVKG